VLATRAQLIAIEQNVLLDAAVAYMNLHRAIQAQSLRASNVNLIKEQLRAAQDRFDVGEVTRTDVATAEARLAAAKSQLAQANGDRTRAAAEFQRAVGRKPGAVRAPGRLPRISSNVNSAIHTARQGHPDLQAIQHQIKAAELTVEGAKLARMPQVTLNSSATIDNTPGNGLQTQLGLRASGVLYSGGAISSQIRAAMAQRDATRAALHSTQHLIDQSVQNAYVLLNVARASGTAGDEQIRASEVAFKGIQEEALLGARTTLDVLNAEQELLDARNSRISAGVDEQIAAYTILAATGQLTAQALNLGVTIYDPTEYYNLVRTAPTSRSAQGKALDRVLKSIGQ
ncbi:MAG: TolC family protein, partial [Pseudomonadota bacterium]